MKVGLRPIIVLLLLLFVATVALWVISHDDAILHEKLGFRLVAYRGWIGIDHPSLAGDIEKLLHAKLERWTALEAKTAN